MREVLTRPSPLKKHHQKRFLSRLVFLLVTLIILYIGLGLVSGINKLSINEIEISGTESLDSSELAKEILGSMSGNVALFYSESNIFLYSKDKIAMFLKEKFPRVYKVISIERNKQKLNIQIEERHGAYTWCGHDAPQYVNRFNRAECYFLDQDGFVFDQAPNFTEGVYLSVYGGLSRDGEIIGGTINLQNNISDVYQMLEVLEDNDMPVHSLVLKEDGQHEFLLDINSDIGEYPKIIWNEDNSLADTLGKLGSALSEENFKTDWQERSGSLLYIDTRFNNRVFYKFQDEKTE